MRCTIENHFGEFLVIENVTQIQKTTDQVMFFYKKAGSCSVSAWLLPVSDIRELVVKMPE